MRDSRILIAVLLCATLALMRVFGMHVHVPHDARAHAVPGADHHNHHDETASSVLVSEHDEGHAQAHLAHGDLDAAGVGGEMPGKLPSLPLVLAFLAAALCVFFSPATGHAVWPAAYRIPGPGRRIQLLPPSQAPPRAR